MSHLGILAVGILGISLQGQAAPIASGSTASADQGTSGQDNLPPHSTPPPASFIERLFGAEACAESAQLCAPSLRYRMSTSEALSAFKSAGFPSAMNVPDRDGVWFRGFAPDVAGMRLTISTAISDLGPIAFGQPHSGSDVISYGAIDLQVADPIKAQVATVEIPGFGLGAVVSIWLMAGDLEPEVVAERFAAEYRARFADATEIKQGALGTLFFLRGREEDAYVLIATRPLGTSSRGVAIVKSVTSHAAEERLWEALVAARRERWAKARLSTLHLKSESELMRYQLDVATRNTHVDPEKARNHVDPALFFPAAETEARAARHAVLLAQLTKASATWRAWELSNLREASKWKQPRDILSQQVAKRTLLMEDADASLLAESARPAEDTGKTVIWLGYYERQLSTNVYLYRTYSSYFAAQLESAPHRGYGVVRGVLRGGVQFHDGLQPVFAPLLTGKQVLDSTPLWTLDAEEAAWPLRAAAMRAVYPKWDERTKSVGRGDLTADIEGAVLLNAGPDLVATIREGAWSNAGGQPCRLHLLRPAGKGLRSVASIAANDCSRFVPSPIAISGQTLVAFSEVSGGKYGSCEERLVLVAVTKDRLQVAFREPVRWCAMDPPEAVEGGGSENASTGDRVCQVSRAGDRSIRVECPSETAGQGGSTRTHTFNGSRFVESKPPKGAGSAQER